MKHNPYRRIERILKVTGWVFMGAIGLFLLASMAFLLFIEDAWYIPLVFLGACVVALGLSFMAVVIEMLWGRARDRWETKHRGDED